MAKDVDEVEHRSPREYEPDPTPIVVQSVPTLRQIDSKPTPSRLIQVADPATVTADGKLRATFVDTGGYTTFIFQHGKLGFVPARICAVVPDGLSDFSRVLIFFHPLPTGQAGYDDRQYEAQAGGWHKIYRYNDQQGGQVAASKKKIVFIFPIFSLASKDTCGGFPAEWKGLIEIMMKHIRDARFAGLKGQPFAIKDVITASYSAGIHYMRTFLNTAKGLSGHLREVWDYDGRFSTNRTDSEGISGTVLTYDQRAVKLTEVNKQFLAGTGIHCPELRWRDLPNNQTSFLDVADPNIEKPKDGSLFVHGGMPRYMMFHSLSRSSVGS